MTSGQRAASSSTTLPPHDWPQTTGVRSDSASISAVRSVQTSSKP